MPTPRSALLYHPPSSVSVCSRGRFRNTEEFALSWRGKCFIRTHAPLLLTLPPFLAQHTTLDWNFSFFFICWMPCDVRWAAVEMRDWFNKESVSEEGGCSTTAAHSSPKNGPVKWFDACCMGPLSAEHWVTRGSTSRGIKSTLLFSACQTAARAA